jgi:integrase
MTTSIGTQVEEYLAHRRQLGYELYGDGLQLHHFARYAAARNFTGPVTTAIAAAWAAGASSKTGAARRLSIIRGFAKYRRVFEPKTEIPPPLFGTSKGPRPTPYIYSDEEIRALLQAAAALSPAPGLRLRSHTYVTLLGLLASSGLRISEALKLARRDVDLRLGVLTIVQTKFKKSRIVPLHPSTARALQRYAELRDLKCAAADSGAPFFANDRGRALAQRTVNCTFEILRRSLGLVEGRRAPRIHDLRHSMAVRRLLAWYREGADVGSKIAALSTYLGHVEVCDTYWYLSAVPELMAIAGARFESFARQVRRRS